MMTEVLKFSVESSPSGDRLAGTWCNMGAGSAGLQTATYCGYLGAELVGGTVTGALRQFNLPTSRAPGDWPVRSLNGVVRY